MVASEYILTMRSSSASLSRILGLGFGIAVIFGGTVGVDILRLPGAIAGQLGSFWPIMLIWIAGGCYALLGAISIAELGTAMPQAGGFYIYAKHAFGPAVGFFVGWADWLNNCAVVAYGAVAAAEYIAALVAALRCDRFHIDCERQVRGHYCGRGHLGRGYVLRQLYRGDRPASARA